MFGTPITTSAPSEEAAHRRTHRERRQPRQRHRADDRPQATRPVRRLQREARCSFLAAATNVRLFAFDRRGRAIDPGAVAAWWARLATSFTNLFASGVAARTATVDAQLTVQLVGPDDAPAGDDVLARLVTTNSTGTGPVRVRGTTASGAATFALTGGTADAAPRAARSRHCPPAPTARPSTSGPPAPVGGVSRDFVRVALVDVERHLTGQPRVAPSGADAPVQRRAADQARAVDPHARRAGDRVGRPDRCCSRPRMPRWPGCCRSWAPARRRSSRRCSTGRPERSTAPTLPAVAPPDSLPEPGHDVGAHRGRHRGQRHGRRTTRARRDDVRPEPPGRLGARVAAVLRRDERPARSAAPAAAGWSTPAERCGWSCGSPTARSTPPNRMGLDVHGRDRHSQAARYPEVRLERPAPVGGAMPALSAVTDTVVACETGQSFAGGVPAGALASGVDARRAVLAAGARRPGEHPGRRQWNSTTIAAAPRCGGRRAAHRARLEGLARRRDRRDAVGPGHRHRRSCAPD